jgi:hypothetical protein
MKITVEFIIEDANEDLKVEEIKEAIEHQVSAGCNPELSRTLWAMGDYIDAEVVSVEITNSYDTRQ